MMMRRAMALLTAATITVTTAVVTDSAQAGRQAIDWQPCPDAPGLECGTLTVPVDWSRPAGQTIHIALSRRRATVRNYFELAAYRTVLERTAAPDVKRSPLGEILPLLCVGWPGVTTNPQHRLRITGATPILMVNSRFDPATPYRWATGVASQSRSLVLLDYDGWGHVSYFSGSRCVTDTVDTYLLTQRTPPQGTHCPAVEPPGAFEAQRRRPGSISLTYV